MASAGTLRDPPPNWHATSSPRRIRSYTVDLWRKPSRRAASVMVNASGVTIVTCGAAIHLIRRTIGPGNRLSASWYTAKSLTADANRTLAARVRSACEPKVASVSRNAMLASTRESQTSSAGSMSAMGLPQEPEDRRHPPIAPLHRNATQSACAPGSFGVGTTKSLTEAQKMPRHIARANRSRGPLADTRSDVAGLDPFA